MKRRIVLGLMFASVAAFAAAKPDFSGSWKLDPAKSDFGQMKAPDKMERVIEHKDPEIKVKTTQSTPNGDRSTETAYTIDGKEQKQDSPRGAVMYTPKWDGDAVVIESRRSVTVGGQQVDITGVERWSLTDGGKSMTIDTKMVLPQGEITMKAVFVKQ
jgi:hypothetical protein